MSWYKRSRKVKVYLMKDGTIGTVESWMARTKKSRSTVHDLLQYLAVDTRRVNTDAQHLYLENEEWRKKWFREWQLSDD